MDHEDRDLSEEVIGAAIEVHRVLGAGFLESTYETALAIELEIREIPFTRQAPVALTYKDRPLGTGRIDLLIANTLIVELKAVESLHEAHTRQVVSYLKATGHTLGLILNFNSPTLIEGVRRVVI